MLIFLTELVTGALELVGLSNIDTALQLGPR